MQNKTIYNKDKIIIFFNFLNLSKLYVLSQGIHYNKILHKNEINEIIKILLLYILLLYVLLLYVVLHNRFF